MLQYFKNRIKQLGQAVVLQTGSKITEKDHLLCNTHNDTICHITIIPFHQPGTGR